MQNSNITSSNEIAGVAQLVERRTENPYVVSPILTAGISKPLF